MLHEVSSEGVRIRVHGGARINCSVTFRRGHGALWQVMSWKEGLAYMCAQTWWVVHLTHHVRKRGTVCSGEGGCCSLRPTSGCWGRRRHVVGGGQRGGRVRRPQRSWMAREGRYGAGVYLVGVLASLAFG